MDLVAGELREILLAISVDDVDGLDDRSRFAGHLALGGGLDQPRLKPSASQAGPTGASLSSTRTPWQDRGCRNATGPSAPRRGALSISSMPSMPRRVNASARSGTSKQTW